MAETSRKSRWALLLVFLVTAGIVRFFGFVQNFWLVLAIAVTIWFFVVLRDIFPNQRRAIKWSLGPLIVFWILTAVYPVYFKPYIGSSVAAGKRAVINASIEVAATINPPNLATRKEILDKTQVIQDGMGERHAKELSEITLESVKGGNIGTSDALDKIALVQKEELAARKKSERVLINVRTISIPSRSRLPVWHMILVGCALLLLSIPKFRIPGRRIWATGGALVIVGGLVLSLFQAQVRADIPTTHQWDSAPECVPENPEIDYSEDDVLEDLNIALEACWSPYYTLPDTWNEFEWEPVEEGGGYLVIQFEGEEPRYLGPDDHFSLKTLVVRADDGMVLNRYHRTFRVLGYGEIMFRPKN